MNGFIFMTNEMIAIKEAKRLIHDQCDIDATSIISNEYFACRSFQIQGLFEWFEFLFMKKSKKLIEPRLREMYCPKHGNSFAELESVIKNLGSKQSLSGEWAIGLRVKSNV